MADWDFDHTTEVNRRATNELRPAKSSSATTEDRLVPPERAYLVVVMGPGVGRKYEVKDKIIIGRSPDADIQLAFGDVSRSHARVSRADTLSFFVEDLGSRNGTLVNGLPVGREELRFGDRIQIGASTILLFTYHDQLEEQLLQSQKMESIGRLAGGIAHDFNNLLGAVLNNVDFLDNLDPDERVGAEDVRACLGDIKTAIGRAVDLTKQMLGFARRGKYEDRPTSVTDLVREVSGMVRRTFDRAITVQARVEPELFVRGDRTQLHQVLMNLCLNARDAMAEGGLLCIEAEEVEPEQLDEPIRAFLNPGCHVVLTVRDNGAGMDEETRLRAFEPFFTTKPPGAGTGLGLATVYGIVKNHGGHVLLLSEKGKGSTFRVFLPAIEQAPAELDTGPQRLLADAGTGTVLLADDEEVVRRSTRRLLKQLGFEVITAADGEEAVHLYEKHKGEILFVLLDLIMPRMGGEAAFEELKRIDPDVRVLIASGYTDESRARQLTNLGAKGFLPKPFDHEALQAAILKVLDLCEVPTDGYIED
jgi:signal transduction histidine kinase/CheY-like chemotaxis protein